MTNFETHANDMANLDADLYGAFGRHREDVKQVVRDANPNMDEEEEVTKQAWSLIMETGDHMGDSEPEDKAVHAIKRYKEYLPKSR